jgi:enamine deaminase RidA (YjgF/YER057c/UK114 family)
MAVSGGMEVYVAGQFGCDPSTRKCVKSDFIAQWDQALSNVAAVVRAAGGTGESIVSVRIYVLSMESYQNAPRQDVGASWIKHIGKWFPPITLVEVGALEDPDAVIEIEAVARVDR